MLKVIQNFCGDTNIHGFMYIGQVSSHRIERIFWAISIFVSFTLTGILIYKFIIESQANPIVIFTDQNAISVQDINFPSLSFCPGIIFETIKNPFKYTEIKEMLENQTIELSNLTLDELKMMQIVSLVANDRFMSGNYPNLSITTEDFLDVLNTFGSFIGESVKSNVLPTYYFFNGNWSNKYPMNLTRTIGPTGFCHTFNFPNSSQMFRMESISQDFNFTNISKHGTAWQLAPEYNLTLEYPVKPVNPKKCLYIGYTKSVYVLHSKDYRIKGLIDVIPAQNFDGIKLMFHDTFEMIFDDAITLHTRKKCYLKILVTPKVLRIDSSIMDFDLTQSHFSGANVTWKLSEN
ncbi:hypothetical protein ACKWTF_008880 [Chironomus riparius]